MVQYFDYQDIFSENMLYKITIHIPLIFDSTMSILVLLESGCYFMTSGMLNIDQRSVLMYLLQLILRVVFLKIKDYWKIIAISEEELVASESVSIIGST
jgi:hypothetical protein